MAPRTLMEYDTNLHFVNCMTTYPADPLDAAADWRLVLQSGWEIRTLGLFQGHAVITRAVGHYFMGARCSCLVFTEMFSLCTSGMILALSSSLS